MKRILVYVDGFNFYYGLFGLDKKKAARPNSEKWIDIAALARMTAAQIWQSESQFEIVQLRYCTSQPLFDARDPGQIQRHQQLMNAIGSLLNTKVVYGSFVERQKNARLYAPSKNVSDKHSEYFDLAACGKVARAVTAADVQKHSVLGHTYEPDWQGKGKRSHPATQSSSIRVSMREEKGSDVNLAAYLVRDSLRESFDGALVFSNDSDLADAITLAREESGQAIWVISPHFRNRAVLSGNPYSRQGALVNAASGICVIDVNLLARCQFPLIVHNADGAVVARRPKEWK
ncbi:MAG: NYN domain-containing protein [Thermomicrobiales bacterium]|nr:NYN domain-containing protein [Thermomicrobiales bacterium]MCO5228257.1 NYN domain-containing protein [Thermomicrobiales bacterium]